LASPAPRSKEEQCSGDLCAVDLADICSAGRAGRVHTLASRRRNFPKLYNGTHRPTSNDGVPAQPFANMFTPKKRNRQHLPKIWKRVAQPDEDIPSDGLAVVRRGPSILIPECGLEESGGNGWGGDSRLLNRWAQPLQFLWRGHRVARLLDLVANKSLTIYHLRPRFKTYEPAATHLTIPIQLH